MPYLRDEISYRFYKAFLYTAMERSDAVMLIHRKHFAHIYTPFADYLKEDQEIIDYQNQSVIQSYMNLDRYKKNCLLFMKNLEPFLIKVRHNPIWPSTEVGFPTNEEFYDICLYKATPQIFQYLLQPKRLYNWIYPDFPEDLCLFKDNRCWFLTSSHEEYARLFADSEEDVVFWEGRGLTFFDKFDYNYDVLGRFVEEY